MRAPLPASRRPRVSGRVCDTLGTLGGVPLCQGFDLIILFQEYQEYQLTLRRGTILLVDTLRNAGGDKTFGPPDLDNMGSAP
jgi:hypothetical protein